MSKARISVFDHPNQNVWLHHCSKSSYKQQWVVIGTSCAGPYAIAYAQMHHGKWAPQTTRDTPGVQKPGINEIELNGQVWTNLARDFCPL